MSITLVAGASGLLGRAVASELTSRGEVVRVMGRSEERLKSVAADSRVVADALAGPDALMEAMQGVERVFSCLGASVLPSASGLWQTYDRVDRRGNLNILEAAKRASVKRFAYVSVANSDQMQGLQYVDAHEAVVDALRASELEYAVVRPTGFFSAFGALLPYARRGRVPLIGDPSSRTNPIDERDLAIPCADAVTQVGFGERTVGGPEVLTRGEIVEHLFGALGTPVKVRAVPAGLARAASHCVLPFAPRIAHIIRFYAWVGSHDCVAEAYGRRNIQDYFRGLVNDA